MTGTVNSQYKFISRRRPRPASNGVKIIDISHSISKATPVYPGNPKVKIKTIRGKTSTHSEVFFGTHTATHVDAPMHVFKNASGLNAISLDTMVGPCRVLDMTNVKESIRISDLKKYKIKKGERILVKTKNSARPFKKFYNNYIYLDGDAAEYLTKINIQLFGIDYLSVKKRGGSDNRPHTALLRKKIVIFEGLDLSKVKPGKYYFIGLPLKFESIDGAPARAILLDSKIPR